MDPIWTERFEFSLCEKSGNGLSVIENIPHIELLFLLYLHNFMHVPSVLLEELAHMSLVKTIGTWDPINMNRFILTLIHKALFLHSSHCLVDWLTKIDDHTLQKRRAMKESVAKACRGKSTCIRRDNVTPSSSYRLHSLFSAFFLTKIVRRQSKSTGISATCVERDNISTIQTTNQVRTFSLSFVKHDTTTVMIKICILSFCHRFKADSCGESASVHGYPHGDDL